MTNQYDEAIRRGETRARQLEILAPRIAALFPPTTVPPCACVAPSCLELGCPNFWYSWLANLTDRKGERRFKQMERLWDAVEEITKDKGWGDGCD